MLCEEIQSSDAASKFADYLEWGCVPGKQKNIGIGQHTERS